MSSTKHTIQDGFEDVFTFSCHKLQVRGYNLFEVVEDARRSYSGFLESYVSWDSKQVYVWETDLTHQTPTILHQLKLPQPNFICYVVYVPKLKIFLAAALDMSFKIYDKQLRLLESIHHEERAILHLEYDIKLDLIIAAGASGISLWKLYRNSNISLAHVIEKIFTFPGFINSTDTWISKLIYDTKHSLIYAMKDCNVQVLNVRRRNVVTELKDVHESPVNVVCWYERNQFYLTGCSRGEIKCWSSSYVHRPNNCAVDEQSRTNNYKMKNSSVSKVDHFKRTYALLHTFRSHSKAVTVIKLHPMVSGLAITGSLDGTIKILNLENLSEIYSITCSSGILDLKVIAFSLDTHNCYSIGQQWTNAAEAQQFGVLFSTEDCSFHCWKITSCCDYYALASAEIKLLLSFSNIQTDNIKHNNNKHKQYKHTRDLTALQENTTTNETTTPLDKDTARFAGLVTKAKLKFKSSLFRKTGHISHDPVYSQNELLLEEEERQLNAAPENKIKWHFSDPPKQPNVNGASSEHQINEDNNCSNQMVQATSSRSTSPKRKPVKFTAKPQTYIVSSSTQDLRCFLNREQVKVVSSVPLTPNGEPVPGSIKTSKTIADVVEELIINKQKKQETIHHEQSIALGDFAAAFDPEHIIDGITAYSISVYQKLLFCVCENNVLRIHDLTNFHLTTLKDVNLKPFPSSETVCTCCVLVDCVPSDADVSNENAGNLTNSNNVTDNSDPCYDNDDQMDGNNSLKTDVRGVPLALHYLDECLVIGCKNGIILFVDTFRDYKTIYTLQAHSGVITTIKYNNVQKQLYVVGRKQQAIKANSTSTSSSTSTSAIYSAYDEYSVRIYSLPNLDFLWEIGHLNQLSCFAVSPTLSMCAVGLTTGSVKLYGRNQDEASSYVLRMTEITSHDESHDGTVLDITFNDGLRVYASCALDRTVRIWDYDKRPIRTVTLNQPSYAIISISDQGDFLITQGKYILAIPRKYWDEGDVLHACRTEYDPWADDDDKLNRIVGAATKDEADGSEQDNNETLPLSRGTSRHNSATSTTTDDDDHHLNSEDTKRVGTAPKTADSSQSGPLYGAVDVVPGGTSAAVTAGTTGMNGRRMSKQASFTHRNSRRHSSRGNHSADLAVFAQQQTASARKLSKAPGILPGSILRLSPETFSALGGNTSNVSSFVINNTTAANANINMAASFRAINNLRGSEIGSFNDNVLRNSEDFMGNGTLAFLTETKQNVISIDHIEDEVLPKQELQNVYHRPLYVDNTVITKDHQQPPQQQHAQSHQLATTTSPTAALTLTAVTALNLNNYINHDNPNKSSSNTVDTLHPRFLVHRKPVAKAFNLSDIETHLKKQAKEIHKQNTSFLPQSNIEGVELSQRSFLGAETNYDYNHVHHSNNGNNQRKTQISSNGRHDLIMSSLAHVKQQFLNPNQDIIIISPLCPVDSISESEKRTPRPGSQTVRFAPTPPPMAEIRQQIIKEEISAAQPVVSLIQEISLNSRANLTLLTSNDMSFTSDIREQANDVICAAAAGMRVSTHYKKYREDVLRKREEAFKVLLTKSPAPPIGGRNSSFRPPVRNTASLRTVNTEAVALVVAKLSPNSLSPNSETEISALGSPGQFSAMGTEDAFTHNASSERNTMNGSSAATTLVVPIRRKHDNMSLSKLPEDEIARLVERKLTEQSTAAAATVASTTTGVTAEDETKRLLSLQAVVPPPMMQGSPSREGSTKLAVVLPSVKGGDKTLFLPSAPVMVTNSPKVQADSLSRRRKQMSEKLVAKMPTQILLDVNNANINHSRRTKAIVDGL